MPARGLDDAEERKGQGGLSRARAADDADLRAIIAYSNSTDSTSVSRFFDPKKRKKIAKSARISASLICQNFYYFLDVSGVVSFGIFFLF